MKITAVEAIRKYYAEKGFQDAKVKIVEKKDTLSQGNTLSLNFYINKGTKVHISNINFGGNTVEAGKLKSN